MLPITSAVFALIEGVQQKHITIPRKLVPFFHLLKTYLEKYESGSWPSPDPVAN